MTIIICPANIPSRGFRTGDPVPISLQPLMHTVSVVQQQLEQHKFTPTNVSAPADERVSAAERADSHFPLKTMKLGVFREKRRELKCVSIKQEGRGGASLCASSALLKECSNNLEICFYWNITEGGEWMGRVGGERDSGIFGLP